LDLQLGDIVEVNRAKFLKRWGTGCAAGAVMLASQQELASRAKLEDSISSSRPSVGLFSPYNMIPGGGEKYLLSIAQALGHDYDPCLVTPEKYSRIRVATIARALELSLGRLRLITIKELEAEDKFDVWIAMGNAIVPPSPPRGKKNVFILQFPFPTDQGTIDRTRSWLDGYDMAVVYSQYAYERVAELYKSMGVADKEVQIVAPPVSIAGRQQPMSKRRGSILSVGRFFSGWHCKNQHLMIEAFRKLTETLKGEPLELRLAGSLHPERENREYFAKCKLLAEGLPVYFHLDATPAELRDLYSSASIYWHATGLGADLASNPEKAEHFGITVVEAMASGCIPVVFSQGGPAEIVENGVSGLTFSNQAELLSSTAAVICEWDTERVEAARNAAISRARVFDIQYFNDSWRSLIEGLRPDGKLSMVDG
jgi:glycosyltransferase involved in cell wall biosynthesis